MLKASLPPASEEGSRKPCSIHLETMQQFGGVLCFSQTKNVQLILYVEYKEKVKVEKENQATANMSEKANIELKIFKIKTEAFFLFSSSLHSFTYCPKFLDNKHFCNRKTRLNIKI